jgi:hypothetical protein
MPFVGPVFMDVLVECT